MGCGTSRSPARVGVIVEDEASLYPELFPPDECWMGESARETTSSFCNSPSPPPYTPLPLSGHVTLMLGHEQCSPAKRQNSLQSSSDQYVSSSLLESLFHRERRESVASHHREGENEMEAAAAATRQPSADPILVPLSDSIITADEGAWAEPYGCPSFPEEPILPLRLAALSSSFPSARPPSPFPRSRSLSFQLPPLRTLRSPEECPPELLQQTPHRLPPLRELPSLEAHQLKKRTRSRSCQTSSLLSPSPPLATIQ